MRTPVSNAELDDDIRSKLPHTKRDIVFTLQTLIMEEYVKRHESASRLDRSKVRQTAARRLRHLETIARYIHVKD